MARKRRTPHLSAAEIHDRDQYDAAQRELGILQSKVGVVLGGGQPGWLTPAIARVIGRHVETAAMGRGWMCDHVQGSRIPIFAAAGHPGDETCGQCVAALLPLPADEHRCDGCDQVLPGELMCGSVQLGLLLLSYGMCRVCLIDVGAVAR